MIRRTLADGRIVTARKNDGIRKRCDCPRRSWASCPHPWHFSFKVRGGTHHRFALDKYAAHPIVTREDALAERDRLRLLIRAGNFPPTSPPAPTTPADLTFETFTEKWRAVARADEAKTLRANDTAICNRLGALVIEGSRLQERPIGLITEDIIEQAFAQLQSLAGSTQNKYRDVLRLMQRWGLKKGYLNRPWFSTDNEVIVHKPTTKRERRLVADALDDKSKLKEAGEERRLLTQATPWLQRLIIAALETGCRRGELLSLQWADVALSRGVLTIRADKAKSGKSRDLPISPRLLAILKMIDKDPAGHDHTPTAYVFGNAVGEQIKDPKKLWLKCCDRAGIENLHFHDLRHEAGSRMLEAGWPLSHVQYMLGHADPKTTGTYLNATVQHLLDSMRRFGSGSHALHDLAQSTDREPPPVVQGSDSNVAKTLVN